MYFSNFNQDIYTDIPNTGTVILNNIYHYNSMFYNASIAEDPYLPLMVFKYWTKSLQIRFQYDTTHHWYVVAPLNKNCHVSEDIVHATARYHDVSSGSICTVSFMADTSSHEPYNSPAIVIHNNIYTKMITIHALNYRSHIVNDTQAGLILFGRAIGHYYMPCLAQCDPNVHIQIYNWIRMLNNQ